MPTDRVRRLYRSRRREAPYLSAELALEEAWRYELEGWTIERSPRRAGCAIDGLRVTVTATERPGRELTDPGLGAYVYAQRRTNGASRQVARELAAETEARWRQAPTSIYSVNVAATAPGHAPAAVAIEHEGEHGAAVEQLVAAALDCGAVDAALGVAEALAAGQGP